MTTLRLSVFPFAALALVAGLAAPAVRAEGPARVYGAASVTNAFNDTAKLWAAKGHPAPVNVYGASSALAKQIEARAPADIFVSADQKWMDYLADKKMLVPGSRLNLLGNRLVLIAPKGREFPVRMERGFNLPAAINGKLCTGEPGSVPVGIYAKQSLTALGWWNDLSARVVGTDDVRAALKFVESGACAAGIVYATDAAISDKVTVVGTFPENTHPPIVYPMSLVQGARPDANGYLNFLTGPEATAVFRRYGFSAPVAATTVTTATVVAPMPAAGAR